MFGVADRLGSIAPGRMANLVVATGDLFGDDARILTTWVDGHYYDTDQARERDVRGTWDVVAEGKTLPLVIEGKLEKPDAKLGGEKATVSVKDDAVLVIAPAKLFDKGEGSIRLTGQILGETIAGNGEVPGLTNVRWNAKRTAAFTPAKKPDEKPSPLAKPLD